MLCGSPVCFLSLPRFVRGPLPEGAGIAQRGLGEFLPLSAQIYRKFMQNRAKMSLRV